MTHEEICGPDTLRAVYRHGSEQEQAVVRWCCKCGAIVIDIDYDGRTTPGAVMPMRFPESIRKRST